MLPLFILNSILIAISVLILVICNKNIKTERGVNILFLVAAIISIIVHYSSLAYHHFSDNSAYEYLKGSPNLLFPLYPCNAVMWSCLIYGLLRNKNSKSVKILEDYIFWFGIAASVIGMFANEDFVNNPTLLNYDTTKSIVAHATLFFNVMLFAVFGKVNINLPRNMKSITIASALMYAIGLYCNLVIQVLRSEEFAYEVNAMFILHSPFAAVPFLRYPVLILFVLLAYFIVFNVCELIAYEKGNRWFDKIKSKKQDAE
jgi:hypothetical protein